LILKIWQDEEIPAQWAEGIIAPIHKKGDKLACHNYRPVILSNISYKMFAILLNNRLVVAIESKLDNCQMRFRSNRSTIDNIFLVKQIYEKCCEFHIDIYNIFVDYTQEFDSVKRCQIIYCAKTIIFQPN
jgi:hypothetical protein